MKKIAIVDIAHDSLFLLKRVVDGTSFFEIETASVVVSDSEETFENRYKILKTKLLIGKFDWEHNSPYIKEGMLGIFLPSKPVFENVVNVVDGCHLILEESQETEKLFSWEERFNFFTTIKDHSFLPSAKNEKNPWQVRWRLKKFW